MPILRHTHQPKPGGHVPSFCENVHVSVEAQTHMGAAAVHRAQVEPHNDAIILRV
jgi:hypothetical protein